MTIHRTPIYGFEYMDLNEPLKSLAGISKQVAERTEKAMADSQVPPGNPDVNAILTRLNNLERRAAGRATITVTASAHGFIDITFPPGRFTLPPVVTASKQGDVGAKYVPYVMSVTATGCRIGLYAGDGTLSSLTLIVGWTAVQMSATSATG